MIDRKRVHTHPHNHEVLFYSRDAFFVETVTNFVAAALNAGSAAIVFATKPHRDLLLEALTRQGLDIDAVIDQGSYIPLDAAQVLSMFMVKGWPDRARFFEGFDKLLAFASRTAKNENRRIAVFGEGVALLFGEGNIEAAIRLEQLGSHLANKYNVEIMCGYPLSLCTTEHETEVKRICAQHSAVHSR
jgi:hypothetical protein